MFWLTDRELSAGSFLAIRCRSRVASLYFDEISKHIKNYILIPNLLKDLVLEFAMKHAEERVKIIIKCLEISQH